MPLKLEIVVDSIQSARNAESGGADRIELCSALEIGGLTPSNGFIRKVKEILEIPVFVMIRPRMGNFVYDEFEISQMKEDIINAIDVGINGFVFGTLSQEADKYKVDKLVCSELMSVCNNFPVTFHRAFDLVHNPYQALEDLIDLKITRILTSGQSPTAIEGMDLIKKLVGKADNKITIMPGSGINENNILDIKSNTGATEFHSSAQTKKMVSVEPEIVKGTTYNFVTSHFIVANMKRLLEKD